MVIPLPIPGWSVLLTSECDYDNNPLGDDLGRYTLGLQEEDFPELLLKKEFEPSSIRKDARVVEVRPIWYICPYNFTRPASEIDGVFAEDYFDEHLKGHYVSNCFGRARVYTRRSEALADLARCDLGVGHVWRIARARTGAGKKLAQAVLAGDMGSLPILADALEEEGHPLATQVRELCSPPGKKRRSKKKQAD
jgi:hypothetical protein